MKITSHMVPVLIYLHGTHDVLPRGGCYKNVHVCMFVIEQCYKVDHAYNACMLLMYIYYILKGRMYEDAQRWGYLFQSYVLLTMMELHHKRVVSLL